MRIAISGGMYAGKSTLARELQARTGVLIGSFAQGFKPWIEAAGLQKGDPAYRILCQQIGAGGRAIDEDIWIKALERRHYRDIYGYGLIIDDLRYANELTWALRMGFTVVRLEIPEEIRAERGTLIDHESEHDLSDISPEIWHHSFTEVATPREWADTILGYVTV